MSFGRPIPSHLRSGSINNASTSSNPSPALLARINEKKTELANLKELQALSAGLADQMALLEQKLSTLSDGTEGIFSCKRQITGGEALTDFVAVATVLANWHNVLRAISMASSKIFCPPEQSQRADRALGALPKPKEDTPTKGDEKDVPLPQTLVRIPTQSAPLLSQSTADSAAD
jgi:DASH complex subunit DAD2